MTSSKNSLKRKIYFIIGPTSSGKTALSIELAKKIGNAEIVSADSRQIYTGFDLSSGKVTKDEMENIPHHMIDIVNPGTMFTVEDYKNMALKKINDISYRGNIPIVCGGTGFYIDTLLFDYNLPNVKPNFELRKELKQKKTSELYTILKQSYLNNLFKKLKYSLFGDKFLDKYNTSDFKNNKHRMMRTIEVVKELGYLPELKKEVRFKNDDYDVEIISTNIDRELLKEKIYKRLIERINAGMIDEIRDVKSRFNLTSKYLEKLGLEFKWVSKYLDGKINLEEMKDGLNRETFQYARRQETWFKRYKQLQD